ncbi:hypothetical protein PCASD_05587 [Puccinia coronata f. sp. avenae]|uniref:Uncharacterized protein n=1 Tax=Puccinia coronata f. sp. avenae TaxID=200324 RepID=A0A2N5UWP7_9BASI|nr:hypothetical protein PCASD_05587 [Puccinia coronata f. sp. avenae]
MKLGLVPNHGLHGYTQVSDPMGWSAGIFLEKSGRLGVQTPAGPPPHAARRPHAYKWREDGRLSVRPRRTGVLAMHACPEGVQALHALRTGVHGRHACPARLT